jgi:C4-dicarboxylate transporter DctM subunit
VAALVLFVPTIMGVVQAMQIDPVYFGVYTIIALAVGQFTPPVGLNLFIACNIAKEKLEVVVRDILPYLLVYIVLLVVFAFVPQLITLFL